MGYLEHSYRSAPADTPVRQQAWNTVAQKVGCGDQDNFQCMQNVDIGRLQQAHDEVYGTPPPYQPKNPYPTAFGPAVVSLFGYEIIVGRGYSRRRRSL